MKADHRKCCSPPSSIEGERIIRRKYILTVRVIVVKGYAFSSPSKHDATKTPFYYNARPRILMDKARRVNLSGADLAL